MLKEKIKTIAALAGMTVVSNFAVPIAACSLPKIENLFGLKIKDVRVEHFPAEQPEHDYDLYVPEYLDIKYGQETVSIVVDDLHIATKSKDMESYDFGFKNNGTSGFFGFLVLGIPGLLISMPIVATFNALWHGVYKLTGMDKDYYLFFQRIKNQLDADTRVKLKEALINTSRQYRESK